MIPLINSYIIKQKKNWHPYKISIIKKKRWKDEKNKTHYTPYNLELLKSIRFFFYFLLFS